MEPYKLESWIWDARADGRKIREKLASYDDALDKVKAQHALNRANEILARAKHMVQELERVVNAN